MAAVSFYKYLLHVIFTGSQTVKVYTITFRPNDAINVIWTPKVINFRRSTNVMFVSFVYNANQYMRVRFPINF